MVHLQTRDIEDDNIGLVVTWGFCSSVGPLLTHACFNHSFYTAQSLPYVQVNLRQCNIDVLEQTALAVSDPASSRYGNYFSAAQVCEIVSCPNRKEAVREVLEWLLGPRVEGGQTVQELIEAGEQGQWLRSEAGRGDESYDVAAKVRRMRRWGNP